MEIEIRPQSRFSLGLDELWQYRELFYFFTWRDIKVKYKQTVLGFAWAVLQPLLLMLVFTLFFGSVLQRKTTVPYPVFAYAGLMLWNVFASGIVSAANSMVSNAQIIKRTYFPRLIIPVSSVLVALFDFVVTIPLFAGLMLFYRVAPSPSLFWAIVPALLLTALATLGPGCLLAALNVKYRDFRYVIPFLVQFLLFVTPVIYPLSFVEEYWLQILLALNPMSGAVTLFRAACVGVAPDWTFCAISAVSASMIFAAGIAYFRRTEASFADLA